MNNKSEDAMIKWLRDGFMRSKEIHEAVHMKSKEIHEAVQKGILERIQEPMASEKEPPPWRASSNNPRMGVQTFAIKVDGGGEVLIDFEMPINEIVERNSEQLAVPIVGLTMRHRNPYWYMPDAKKFIRQKLDEMGYDFIESQMLAIKRTGIWR